MSGASFGKQVNSGQVPIVVSHILETAGSRPFNRVPDLAQGTDTQHYHDSYVFGSLLLLYKFNEYLSWHARNAYSGRG